MKLQVGDRSRNIAFNESLFWVTVWMIDPTNQNSRSICSLSILRQEATAHKINADLF